MSPVPIHAAAHVRGLRIRAFESQRVRLHDIELNLRAMSKVFLLLSGGIG